MKRLVDVTAVDEYLAAQRKQHYSLYPAGKDLLAAFKADLSPYAVSGSTIRFPLAAPVPVKLIERLATCRAKVLGARAKAKAAAPPLKKR